MKLGEMLGKDTLAQMKQVAVEVAVDRWAPLSGAERTSALSAFLKENDRFKRIARFVDAHGRRLCKDPMPGKRIMGEWIETHALALMLEKPVSPQEAVATSAVEVFDFYHLKVDTDRMKRLFIDFVERPYKSK